MPHGILRVYVIDDVPERRAEAVEAALAAGAHAVIVAANPDDLSSAFRGDVRTEVEQWFAPGAARLEKIEGRLSEVAAGIGRVVAPLIVLGGMVLGWAQGRAQAAEDMRVRNEVTALAHWAADRPAAGSPGTRSPES